MQEGGLDLFDKIMMDKHAIDIKEAKCYICGKRVYPEIAFRGVINSNHFWLSGEIYTYWSCETHGGVYAELNGKLVEKPSELFDEIVLSDWDASIKKNEG